LLIEAIKATIDFRTSALVTPGVAEAIFYWTVLAEVSLDPVSVNVPT